MSATKIKLPSPSFEGDLSVEGALLARRSIRSYRDEALELRHASQLLWAAQGVTRPDGHRTCPSAGALYPMELHLAVGRVDGLPSGTYRYLPEEHLLVQSLSQDVRPALANAALGQSMVAKAPLVIVICAFYKRITRKYGERGQRYVFMEAGHAAQNIHLQAVSLHLGTVVVGAFQDERIKSVMRLEEDEEALYLMPIGR